MISVETKIFRCILDSTFLSSVCFECFLGLSCKDHTLSHSWSNLVFSWNELYFNRFVIWFNICDLVLFHVSSFNKKGFLNGHRELVAKLCWGRFSMTNYQNRQLSCVFSAALINVRSGKDTIKMRFSLPKVFSSQLRLKWTFNKTFLPWSIWSFSLQLTQFF